MKIILIAICFCAAAFAQPAGGGVFPPPTKPSCTATRTTSCTPDVNSAGVMTVPGTLSVGGSVVGLNFALPGGGLRQFLTFGNEQGSDAFSSWSAPRQNLLPASEDLTNAAWAKTATTADAGGLIMRESAASSSHMMAATFPVVTGQQYTAYADVALPPANRFLGVYIDGAFWNGDNPRVWISSAGAVVSNGTSPYTVTNLGGGVWRIAITPAAASGTGTAAISYRLATSPGFSTSYLGDVGVSVTIYHAQVNLGASATAYAVTNGNRIFDWSGNGNHAVRSSTTPYIVSNSILGEKFGTPSSLTGLYPALASSPWTVITADETNIDAVDSAGGTWRNGVPNVLAYHRELGIVGGYALQAYTVATGYTGTAVVRMHYDRILRPDEHVALYGTLRSTLATARGLSYPAASTPTVGGLQVSTAHPMTPLGPIGLPVYDRTTANRIWSLSWSGTGFDGIQYSDDWGDTWTSWTTWGTTYTTQYTLAQDIAGDFFFVANSGQSLYRVDNASKAVAKVLDFQPNPGTPTAFSWHPWHWAETDAGVIYTTAYQTATTGLQYIYKSLDSGATWTAITKLVDDYPACKHIHSIHSDPATNRIWVSYGDDSATRGLGWTDDAFATFNVTTAASGVLNGPTGITFTSEGVYASSDYSNGQNYIISSDGTAQTARITMSPPYHLAPLYSVRAVGVNELWATVTDDTNLAAVNGAIVRFTKSSGIGSAWTGEVIAAGHEPETDNVRYYMLSHNGRGVIPSDASYVFAYLVGSGYPGTAAGVYRIKR